MIIAITGIPGKGMSYEPLAPTSLHLQETPNSKGFNNIELTAERLLASQEYTMIESRFRATDRNLTIRLRNHENKRP